MVFVKLIKLSDKERELKSVFYRVATNFEPNEPQERFFFNNLEFENKQDAEEYIREVLTSTTHIDTLKKTFRVYMADNYSQFPILELKLNQETGKIEEKNGYEIKH